MAIPAKSQVQIYTSGEGGGTTVIEAALWWEELSLPPLLLVSRPHLAAIEFFIKVILLVSCFSDGRL